MHGSSKFKVSPHETGNHAQSKYTSMSSSLHFFIMSLYRECSPKYFGNGYSNISGFLDCNDLYFEDSYCFDDVYMMSI